MDRSNSNPPFYSLSEFMGNKVRSSRVDTEKNSYPCCVSFQGISFDQDVVCVVEHGNGVFGCWPQHAPVAPSQNTRD